jgi:helix-turn-helix protein
MNCDPLINAKQVEWPDVRQLTAVLPSIPMNELPRLLGQLRELEATVLARMYAAPRSAETTRGPDQLLDVEDAAKRLNVSEDYLYRHWKKLPFAQKYDWGLRFSTRGIDEYIQRGEFPCTLHAINEREGKVDEPRRWARVRSQP